MSREIISYAASAVTAIICIVMAYFILDEEKAAKIKILHKMGHGEAYEKVTFGRKTYWCLFAVTSILACVACFFIATHVGDVMNLARLCICLICITGAATNDIREHRIPNIFPGVMALTGIAFMMIGYLTNQEKWMGVIASCVIATVATALCFGLAFIISKHGIGLGDIKLLCGLALMLGVYAICGTVFISIVSCAVISVILLIISKKKFKDALPFGPFIFVGYVVSVLLGLY